MFGVGDAIIMHDRNEISCALHSTESAAEQRTNF